MPVRVNDLIVVLRISVFLTQNDQDYYFFKSSTNEEYGKVIVAPCLELKNGFSSDFLRNLSSLQSMHSIRFNRMILDPFCGSATTGIVALKYGHKFIGIEKEAWAFPKIKRRLDRVETIIRPG
ncbi:MAG TPA: DNA methyltransferase [Nitrososphaeraceae archaeon]|nr:DNA methyltransferase [Nitrososphaeraceae archaeon]